MDEIWKIIVSGLAYCTASIVAVLIFVSRNWFLERLDYDDYWNTEIAAKLYDSSSVAGVAACGGPVNGWWFWHIKDSKGNLVRLSTQRK